MYTMLTQTQRVTKLINVYNLPLFLYLNMRTTTILFVTRLS